MIDLLGPHLPAWIPNGVNYAAVPISYGVLNFMLALFVSCGLWTRWISLFLVLTPIPYYILQSSNSDHAAGINALDIVLCIQTAITACLVLQSIEKSTAAARRVMSIFLTVFSATELYRVIVFFTLHRSADTVYLPMQFLTAAVYILSGSVLPLNIIWLINARLYADLALQIRIDPLTATLNRRGLDEAAQQQLEQFHRHGNELGIAVIDIDHFKSVNDTHGHQCGDEVLRAIAECLQNSIRETDFLARSGGEEFVLLLPCSGYEQTMQVLERTRRDVQAHAFRLSNGNTINTTISIGATSSGGRTDVMWDDLHREADRALYAAKRDGRNRIVAYTPRLDAPDGRGA